MLYARWILLDDFNYLHFLDQFKLFLVLRYLKQSSN